MKSLISKAGAVAVALGMMSFAVPVAQADTIWTVNYSAGSHGSLTGSTTQMVMSGGTTTPVTAVADSGYHFTLWSDASTTNPRIDTNVLADLAFTAHFALNASTTPTTKEQCKKGGWMSLVGTSSRAFKDQGQCEKFVEHLNKADNGKAKGKLTLSDPNQMIKFDLKTDNKGDKKGKHKDGKVEYWNNDIGLHYKADIMCSYVNKATQEARFMFQIPAGHPGLSGLYVVSYVKSTKGKDTPELYGHASTADLATATAWCKTGSGFSPTMYTVTKGNVQIKK